MSVKKPSSSTFRYATVLASLLVPTLIAQQQASPSTAANRLGACRDAYAASRYGEAAHCFQQIAASSANADREAADASVGQAEALIHLEDLAGAEIVLRDSLRHRPENARALYLLGYVLQRRNQPKASLEIFTKAAAIERPSAEDLRRAALDYVLLEDYPDAEHWLERAVADDPGNAEAWYDLARVHMHNGRFAKAKADLHRSLAIRPSSAKAEDNLGVCLEAENLPDEALAAYRRAVRIADAEPHPSELPYIDYGKLLIEKNAAPAALPILKKATEIAPTSSVAWAQLSHATDAVGDRAMALTAMERAVNLDRGNPSLHFQLGRLYKSAGLPERAKQEFDLSSALYGHTAKE